MEENEVFDSSLLRDVVTEQIKAGKRNFSIDMSSLDYIYSDTINVLMALNKRVLDVNGRLSILAPQPEVLQILRKAGIHNFLKIFETETELLKSTEEMILQTSSIQMADVKAAKGEVPQSEFDQLRSEIGSAFGEGLERGAAKSMGAPPVTTPPHYEEKRGTEEDFNQMFQQFQPQPSPQLARRPEGASSPFQVRPTVPPSSPKLQPKPYSPISQQPPVPPSQPYFRQTGEITTGGETQRFPSAPGAIPPSGRKTAGFEEDLSFEQPVKMKEKRAARFEDLSGEEEYDHEFKKKNTFVPILVVILVVFILGGGIVGLSISFMKKSSKPKTVATSLPQKVTTPTVPEVKPSIPQVPVDSGVKPTIPTPPVTESKVEEKVEERRVETKPVVRKTEPQPKRSVSVSPPIPERKVESRPEEMASKIVFSSNPSGATITINNQTMGTTPFTWTKPVFGPVTVQLSKNGYKTYQKTFEYTGGVINESYTLEKEVTPPPEPITRRTTTTPEPTTVATVTPPPTPTTAKTQASTPKSTQSLPAEEDPFAGIGEEDFSFEEEPAQKQVARATVPPPPTPRSTTTPSPGVATPTPSRPTTTSSTPSFGGEGGEAVIFIASIPPLADVYLGDKMIGKTNAAELKLPAGVQTLRFVKGPKEITKQFTLKPGKNPSQMVRLP
ncbi:MAG: PEGA domain-containing protein [Chitinispirillaceae bacterium]|nr:PEGA domain-containing protein [Chitinispirillaceae bacterium]